MCERQELLLRYVLFESHDEDVVSGGGGGSECMGYGRELRAVTGAMSSAISIGFLYELEAG